MSLLLVFGGLIGILTGAQLLVEGTLNIARRTQVPHFLIGLTILTIGTCVPELSISIAGAFHRLAGDSVSPLVLGQIVGSGIVNITLLLGVAGMAGSLHIHKKLLLFQGFFMIASVLVLLLFSQNGLIDRQEGLTGLLFYGGYLLALPAFVSKNGVHRITSSISMVKAMIWVGLGLLAVVVSANMIVEGGMTLAAQLGMSQTLLGLLVIGVGTSLPELIVAVTAVAKKAPALSAGNLMGSTVFNILVALSGSASLAEVVVIRSEVLVDILILLGLSCLVFIFFATRKKLEPKESLLLIVSYGVYVAFKLLGGMG